MMFIRRSLFMKQARPHLGKKDSEIYKKYNAIFDTMIKPAVLSVDQNFKITRADHVAKPGSFIKDILEKLYSSYIVIANLTDLNPNVFYKLGVRHTLSKRTIMITEDLNSLPSDLKEYRAIEYKPDITAIEEFKKNLANCIEEIIKDPEHADNPVQDRLTDIVKSREEAYTNEIEILNDKIRQLSNSKEKVKTKFFSSSHNDTTKQRIERILTLMNAKRAYAIASSENGLITSDIT